ncbi:MAG: hypothetical protein KAY03_01410 [Arenimonas sp.]|jgi:hypothetical protein|nr:hypothetical protein [Arenimonas sp.]
MYDDAIDKSRANDDREWGACFSKLRASGQFDGGSSIGRGTKCRKDHPGYPSGTELTGFIRIRAGDLDGVKVFLSGNPIFEAGGTVEIRELPWDE